MREPKFNQIDFIANELYQAHMKAENGVGGVRWWCLREDLRDKWLQEARHQYLEWESREQDAYARNRVVLP